MSSRPLRVGLDLAGSLEPLGDTMLNLLDALEERQIELVTFATTPVDDVVNRPVRTFPRALRPLWRRGRGPALDRWLPPLDVIHLAGQLVPPSVRTPMLVSVDDLRPFRDDSAGRWRVDQLRRAVHHGAKVVATSYAARREVQAVLEIANDEIAVAHPAVAFDAVQTIGRDLLVSVTGTTDLFLELEPALTKIAQHHDARVVVLASRAAGTRIKEARPGVTVKSRSRARGLLTSSGTVLHLSDGARFPSLAVAAFAAQIPVVATTTDVNRELLEGAATLVESADYASITTIVERAMADKAHRDLLRAAGRVRAADFAPRVVADQYLRLYRDAVQEWNR